MADTSRGAWLAVVYRVPSKPSTARIAVWKQAKELGGLPLQQSMYLFPDTPEMRLGLAQLARLVEQVGGESTILGATPVDPAQEQAFRESFNQLRNEEYAEVIEDCHALLQHLEREVARGRFDTAEAEDVMRHLEKIRELATGIMLRDCFGASRRKELAALIEHAEQALTQGMKSVASASEGEVAVEETAITYADALRLGATVKDQSVCSREELITRLKEIVGELDGGTVRVRDYAVPSMPDSAQLKVCYSERKGKRCLEIEVEW